MPPRPRRPLHVLKFGGTSVGTAERIGWVARRSAASARRERAIVVVSAMAGTTNLLLRSAQAAARGDRSWRDAAEQIRRRHSEAADILLLAAERSDFAGRLEAALGIFETVCQGFEMVGEATPRGLDRIASLGEVISAELLAATLRRRGARAVALDAAKLIVTDNRFGSDGGGAIVLRVANVDDLEVSPGRRLADGQAGTLAPGAILPRALQHLFDFLLLHPVIPDMRLAGPRIAIKVNAHLRHYRQAQAEAQAAADRPEAGQRRQARR